jgi:hypothetical protein
MGAMVGVTWTIVWLCVRRWWDYLIMAVIAGFLIKPVARNVTGDISPYFPAGLFESPNGKDEFIWVSIVATICIPVILAAVVTGVVGLLWKVKPAARSG